MAIRVGLVGCGKIGQKHLQALARIGDAVLVATCDRDRERAEAAGVPFDAAAYTSIHDLIRHDGLDAVVIATPSGLHPDQAMAAMEQGLDVLVEKPLALSTAVARSLTQFAEDAGVILAVTHFNRLLPAPSRLLSLIRTGRLGTLLSGGIAVRWARPQAYYDEAPWRGTRAMDGGMLFNQAVHALDLAVEAFGPAEEVFAYLDTKTHAIEAEDVVAAAIRFRSGAMATLAATTSVPGVNLEERLTVVGSEGVAVLGPTVNELGVLRTSDAEADARVLREISELPEAPSWQSHFNALSDFFEAVQTRQPPALAAAATLDALALVDALTRSGREHRPVRLEELS
jgi:UDP-N-acetyl-2-amino-2-deoxyglucuronate dehydrogenase